MSALELAALDVAGFNFDDLGLEQLEQLRGMAFFEPPLTWSPPARGTRRRPGARGPGRDLTPATAVSAARGTSGHD